MSERHDQEDTAPETEPEPTPEERAAAEALARALEPARPGEAPPEAPAPEEALGAAALLRHGRALGAPERLAAAAARVLPAVDARRPRRRRWPWLVSTLLVPAAAALLLFAVPTLRRAAPGAGARPLPAPPAPLLEAQARAARGQHDLAALEREMRAYRAAFYDALATRAGDEP
jgi:hypothetical protein